MPENTASNWISDIRWDERGRPYRVYLMDVGGRRAGERSYIPPAEAATINDPRLQAWARQNQRPGASLFQNAGTWNNQDGEWDRGFNWSNAATIGAGALTGAGIAGAFSGGAGGAAAPGGALPSSSVPVSASMVGPAAIGSQGASAGVGAAVPAAAAGAGVSTLRQGLQDGAQAAGGFGWQDAAGLAPLIPLLMSAFGGGNNSGPFGDHADLAGEATKAMALQRQRMEQAQPVYDTLVRMSMGMSPQAYRQDGTSPTPYPYQSPRFGGR
jgi:hypothetical protein